MKAKKRSDEIFDKKMRDKEEMMRIEEENRVKFFQDRMQRQGNRNRNMKTIVSMKNEEYKTGKSMTIKHDIYKKQFMASVKKTNQVKSEKVRREEGERALKFKELEDLRLKKNQENYGTRVEEEKQKILDHENKIKEMEKMEAELLGRLKNSQQMEQSEYGKLEQALKVSSDACELRKKRVTKIRKPRPKEITKMRNSISTNPSDKGFGSHL